MHLPGAPTRAVAQLCFFAHSAEELREPTTPINKPRRRAALHRRAAGAGAHTPSLDGGPQQANSNDSACSSPRAPVQLLHVPDPPGLAQQPAGSSLLSGAVAQAADALAALTVGADCPRSPPGLLPPQQRLQVMAVQPVLFQVAPAFYQNYTVHCG